MLKMCQRPRNRGSISSRGITFLPSTTTKLCAAVCR